jgi:uncharacterized protein DUF3306
VTAPDTKPPAPAPGPAPEAGEGSFLTRWSRRKRAAEAGQPLPEPAPPALAAPSTTPADLPDPATLGFEDDFSAYLGAQVPAALKRAAMSKLFADPSFNQMDGLDVYIEDYNLVPDLPAAERDLLAHARDVLSPAPPGSEAPPPTDAPPATASAEQAAPEAEVSEPAASPYAALPGQAAEPDAVPQPLPKA